MSTHQRGKSESSERALKSAGLRVTAPRRAVLAALCNEPLTMEELKTRVGKEVHQATLYRALPELVRRGLVTEVDFPGPETRYEFSEHHHHHIVCRDCGTVEGVPVCIPPQLLKKALKSTTRFDAIAGHALEFSGICRQCARS